jgi:hypothetical protein
MIKKILKYYFGENKTDTIGLLLAYNGMILFAIFMIWSYQTYGIWGAEPLTFIKTLGGIIR